MAAKKYIQSVQRAMDMLEYIALNGNRCRLQDISQALGLNKSTAHTILATLEQKGYVTQEKNSPRYCIGLNAMILGIVYRRDFFAREKMHKILTELADIVGETTYFVVRIGEQYFYLDAVAPQRNIRAETLLGHFSNLSDGCSIAQVFYRYPHLDTPYIADFEQEEAGMHAMALPLVKNDQLLGVVAFRGPSSRFGRDEMEAAYAQFRALAHAFCV
nr:helix-turn-helix domain-containing protein [Maliibacterium massiliense]